GVAPEVGGPLADDGGGEPLERGVEVERPAAAAAPHRLVEPVGRAAGGAAHHGRDLTRVRPGGRAGPARTDGRRRGGSSGWRRRGGSPRRTAPRCSGSGGSSAPSRRSRRACC